MKPPPIRRIVLTGGPCAGKSTALEHAARWLQARDVHVYVVPEASTLLLRGGANVAGASLDRLVAFQAGILRVSLALEDGLADFARVTHEHAILLCDRGALDGGAYLPAPAWAELLDRAGLREQDLLARYDAVVHLVTAAAGAEAFYGTDSNAVRYETLEEASVVDLRLRDAWAGHLNLRVIDNSTDFPGKLRRVLDAVCEFAGVPGPHGD
jgi:hypothetical protein